MAEVRETTGPDAIHHINLERSVTLIASLAQDAPLSALVERAEREVLAPLRAELPTGWRKPCGNWRRPSRWRRSSPICYW